MIPIRSGDDCSMVFSKLTRAPVTIGNKQSRVPIQLSRTKSILATAIRYLLGFTFVLSAVSKMYYPDKAAAFASIAIELPATSALIITWVIAVAELISGLLLLFGFFVSLSAFFIILLLLLSILSALQTISSPIECGCFGNLTSSKTDVSFFLRNVGLLIGAMIVLKLSSEESKHV
ncbi:MAG: DoxX family protein [Ignavibacteriales bacterium]|nr:DoxX family protein [Ignavibacteriales bacterium]